MRSAPKLVLVLELEAEPQLRLDCSSEAEESRLRDWLASSGAPIAGARDLLLWLEQVLEEEETA